MMKFVLLRKSVNPPVDFCNRLAAGSFRPKVPTIRDFFRYLEESATSHLVKSQPNNAQNQPDNPVQVLTIPALAIKGLQQISDCENAQNVLTGRDLRNVSIA